MNEYGYCWNNPLILVDRNGAWPEWVENVKDWAYEHKEPLKWAFAAGLLAIPVVAAVWIPATVTVAAAVVAGALLGGIAGGITNMLSNSGNFINGCIGGEINGEIVVSITLAIPGGHVFIANLLGGSAGNAVTEFLNNMDSPPSEDHCVPRILLDTIIAGLTQMGVSGGLDKLSLSIGSYIIWDIYKAIYSVGSGTTAGYTMEPLWNVAKDSVSKVKTVFNTVFNNEAVYIPISHTVY